MEWKYFFDGLYNAINFIYRIPIPVFVVGAGSAGMNLDLFYNYINEYFINE